MGDAYAATYTFNTSVGYTDVPNKQVSSEGGVNGNPINGVVPPSPLISDSVTISNGSSSYSVDGKDYAILEILTANGNAGVTPHLLVARADDLKGNEIYSQVVSSDLPFSITTPFLPLTGNSESYSQTLFDCTTYQVCEGYIVADLTVSLTASGTVPETSTWVMMLIGFAGLGFAGYPAQRKTAALAA